MEILNWVGKLNRDSLLEYECLGNGGLGQLDQMVVIPKDWKFNLRVSDFEDKSFGRSEPSVVESVCEGGRWGLNELLVSSER